MSILNYKLLKMDELIKEVLEECEEYFDDKADADHDENGPVINKEMRLLARVRQALEKLKIKS